MNLVAAKAEISGVESGRYVQSWYAMSCKGTGTLRVSGQVDPASTDSRRPPLNKEMKKTSRAVLEGRSSAATISSRKQASTGRLTKRALRPAAWLDGYSDHTGGGLFRQEDIRGLPLPPARKKDAGTVGRGRCFCQVVLTPLPPRLPVNSTPGTQGDDRNPSTP